MVKEALTVIGIPIAFTSIVLFLPLALENWKVNTSPGITATEIKKRKKEARWRIVLPWPVELVLLSSGILVQILQSRDEATIMIGAVGYVIVLGFMIFGCKTCQDCWNMEPIDEKRKKAKKNAVFFIIAASSFFLALAFVYLILTYT